MSLTTEQIHHAQTFKDDTGKTWRRNGKTKTWKTRPAEFRIPVKFGIYAYGYITQSNEQYFTVEE